MAAKSPNFASSSDSAMKRLVMKEYQTLLTIERIVGYGPSQEIPPAKRYCLVCAPPPIEATQVLLIRALWTTRLSGGKEGPGDYCSATIVVFKVGQNRKSELSVVIRCA